MGSQELSKVEAEVSTPSPTTVTYGIKVDSLHVLSCTRSGSFKTTCAVGFYGRIISTCARPRKYFRSDLMSTIRRWPLLLSAWSYLVLDWGLVFIFRLCVALLYEHLWFSKSAMYDLWFVLALDRGSYWIDEINTLFHFTVNIKLDRLAPPQTRDVSYSRIAIWRKRNIRIAFSTREDHLFHIFDRSKSGDGGVRGRGERNGCRGNVAGQE